MVLQTEQMKRLRKTLHIDITEGTILAVTTGGKKQENVAGRAMEDWLERHLYAYVSTPNSWKP